MIVPSLMNGAVAGNSWLYSSTALAVDTAAEIIVFWGAQVSQINHRRLILNRLDRSPRRIHVVTSTLSHMTSTLNDCRI